MQTIYLTILIVLLPFAAFILNFLFLNKSKASGWVSTIAILISSIFSIFVFTAIWNGPVIHVQTIWFTIGDSQVHAGLLLNNLSVLMLALVPLVALPVHIYSTAYMKDDAGYGRYFRYLSFFCFSMLALVVVDNLVLFYAFWELVGFASYLLIGFWFDRPAAVQANKKAFIMNRIGDIGLLTAIIIIYTLFGTFDLEKLFGAEGFVTRYSYIENGTWSFYLNHVLHVPVSRGWTVMAPHTVTQIPAIWQYVAFGGIFLGVAAKSAQFPLHTWLPDAMEGPTSVSALIHAATMVAAGVFLLGRVYPMFNTTELNILAAVGCFTAFMAATIALTQTDLKRILAYSTISQLGYMVMAMGIGAYASSLFHLVTHAFFKCLLFLCAGIVIHQIKHVKEDNHLDIDPQDLANMGGLRKKLPVTFVATLIAGLALIGLPLTSGYLSKEGILVQAFEWAELKGGAFMLIPVFASITSWLTAFYVARMILKVFYGDMNLSKLYPNITIHIGDGGWRYQLPLIMLALCSLFPLFSLNPLAHSGWLTGGLPQYGQYTAGLVELMVPVIINVGSIAMLYYAYMAYIKQRDKVAAQPSLLHRISFNEWYIDAFYQRVIVRAVMTFSKALYWFDLKVIDGLVNLFERIARCIAGAAAWFDKYIVDGLLHLAAALVAYIGGIARRFQNGKVQYYLFSMLLAVIVVFILKILIWNS
ncbi:NADH-quinone oxidoreductase subunit L [Mucilaginibacter sp. ZB1P21]|uniref:NADH-quinone oxidoreductase subunit L n=1 Tax=Mucilaginibacter glaciei TaxID=2772109 RepID=A0A926NSK3_9SPHI|nr:NADH-quinone oxidoreductase subunit L [Mucilaginibacter glaciei]